jgi:hypothetical protein
VTRPNSLLTKVRTVLASKLDPWPDSNEGWCIDCSLNAGKTIIVPVSGVDHHTREHREADPAAYIKLRWSQPSREVSSQ